MRSLTIVCISDTHQLHREVDVPGGDILLHAGDFSMFSKSLAAIEDFNDWLGELPHRHKIVIPGNHEYFLESEPRKRSLLSNATVLINEGVDIMGLNIWGSPITPLIGAAFGRGSAEDRVALYQTIPSDVDVLMTHSPPYGILDRSPGTDTHAGCPQLLDAVNRLKPKIHTFGHVHGAHGTVQIEDTLFVNAALLQQDGSIRNSGIAVRIPQS